MGQQRLSKRQWIALLCGGLLVFTFTSARGEHGAETIDDTGSIFDESPSGAPEITSPPTEKKPPITNPPTPSVPVPPDVRPIEPKPAVPVPKPADVSSTRPPVAKRLPVPDGKAREASLKLIREVYQADYAKNGPADQRALAQRMLDQSRDSTDDVAARYVLLTEAGNRAATAGDAPLAMKAVRVLARTFKTDAPAAALAALALASKANVSADQLNTTARAALDFSREAVLADEFEAAVAAADIAQTAARRGKDAKLIKMLKQQADRVVQLRHGADEIVDATMRLRANPNDAAACLTVGKYRAFVRGDWAAGIGLLSRCDDPVLKPLAEKDVLLRRTAADVNTGVPTAQSLAMGDAWWAASEHLEADASLKASLLTRGCYWYALSAPKLTGMKRVQIEKKINQVRFSRMKGGLVGHYYNNHTFHHEVMERIDPLLNFNWKLGSPAAGITSDWFAVWWRGYIKAPVPGKYKIISDQDDGCRVYLDGKLIIDQWHELHEPVYTAEVELTSEPQSLYIEYDEVTGAARMGLGWQAAGSNKVVTIPASALLHDPEGPLKVSPTRPADVGRFNGHTYKLINSSVPWYAARQWCDDLGGHLAVVETPEEQQFLNALTAGAHCWIGLNDEEEEGVWRLPNGRQAQYLAWVNDEPNNSEDGNFAVTFEGGWGDVTDVRQTFICEWDD